MRDAAVAASLLWAMLFVLYALFGTIVTVAPAIVVRTRDLQQESRRWLRRLPVIAAALWVLLFVVNAVYPLDLCSLCDPGVRFPWTQGSH